MKFWAPFFGVAVCALLPSQGDAGSHRLDARLTHKRSGIIENPHFFDVLSLLVKRKYPNTTESKFLTAMTNIFRTLTTEELESDHLDATILGKYGDGSYTKDDEKYFIALHKLFHSPGMRTLKDNTRNKYVGNRKQNARLEYAVMKVFPELTIEELKSSNAFRIIEEKIDTIVKSEDVVSGSALKISWGT